MTHTFRPGERFLWPAGNGRRVRTGLVDRWVPPRPGGVGRRGSWMVRLDPIEGVDKGLTAWLYPEEMFPLNTPAAELASHVAAVQVRRFGESMPSAELVASLSEAVTLIREALHRAFPEAYTETRPSDHQCQICGMPVPAGWLECEPCAGGEDAAAKRAADV
jgi:hypothetical protein